MRRQWGGKGGTPLYRELIQASSDTPTHRERCGGYLTASPLPPAPFTVAGAGLGAVSETFGGSWEVCGCLLVFLCVPHWGSRGDPWGSLGVAWGSLGSPLGRPVCEGMRWETKMLFSTIKTRFQDVARCQHCIFAA